MCGLRVLTSCLLISRNGFSAEWVPQSPAGKQSGPDPVSSGMGARAQSQGQTCSRADGHQQTQSQGGGWRRPCGCPSGTSQRSHYSRGKGYSRRRRVASRASEKQHKVAEVEEQPLGFTLSKGGKRPRGVKARWLEGGAEVAPEREVDRGGRQQIRSSEGCTRKCSMQAERPTALQTAGGSERPGPHTQRSLVLVQSSMGRRRKLLWAPKRQRHPGDITMAGSGAPGRDHHRKASTVLRKDPDTKTKAGSVRWASGNTLSPSGVISVHRPSSLCLGGRPGHLWHRDLFPLCS